LTYASAAPEDGHRVFVTGNPVRSTFLQQKTGISKFAGSTDEFVVLAVGGSRGALSLNRACMQLAADWLPSHRNVRLIHISGERDYEMVRENTMSAGDNYVLLPYLHEMKEAFDAADVLVSRAGATILAEIAVCRKPAILIPFPFATDNHQEKNARVLENLGAARVLLDRDLDGGSLAKCLEDIRSAGVLETMATAMQKSRPADVEDRILQHIVDVLRDCGHTVC
jgi:UDP-N-acetylglucosamine--N-acetylmuramyl-(pentapeptide) pyrophosphoryl-undecaprenol N-acetylglucosamine transferase